MKEIESLIKLYEKDYYLWLKKLGEYLEKEKVEDEVLESQIGEFMDYLSRALKREFKFKFVDYNLDAFMDKVLNDREAGKRLKTLARRLKLIIDDMPYVVVYYSKNMVDLAEYTMAKFGCVVKEIDHESINPERDIFQYVVKSAMMDALLLHRSNFDKLMEYVRTNFTEKEMEYSRLLINFPKRGKLRVRGKFNTKLAKYAVEKGINYIHREIEDYLVDVIVCASRLQVVDSQELWKDLNSSRLYLEGFLSYAPSLAEEMDGLFEKAKKTARETTKLRFGASQKITFTFEEIMSASRKSIAGKTKKRRK